MLVECKYDGLWFPSVPGSWGGSADWVLTLLQFCRSLAWACRTDRKFWSWDHDGISCFPFRDWSTSSLASMQRSKHELGCTPRVSHPRAWILESFFLPHGKKKFQSSAHWRWQGWHFLQQQKGGTWIKKFLQSPISLFFPPHLSHKTPKYLVESWLLHGMETEANACSEGCLGDSCCVKGICSSSWHLLSPGAGAIFGSQLQELFPIIPKAISWAYNCSELVCVCLIISLISRLKELPMDFSALPHDHWFLFIHQGLKSLRKRIHSEHSLVWTCSSGCAGLPRCPELGRYTVTGTKGASGKGILWVCTWLWAWDQSWGMAGLLQCEGSSPLDVNCKPV